MPRRRTLYPLTILLSLMTAVALFAAGWVIASPGVPDPSSPETESTVRLFYTAVNETISTGNASMLESALAEDIEVKGSVAAVAPDRSGLINFFKSMHITSPQFQLSIASMTATGSRAIVEVTANGDDGGSFVGSQIHSSTIWGEVDSFRVDQQKVSGFWSNSSSAVVLEASDQLPYLVDVPHARVVTLEEVSIPAGITLRSGGEPTDRWIVPETASFTVTPYVDQSQWVTTPAPSDLGIPRGTSISLEPFKLFALPAWNRIDVRNSGHAGARLLVLTLARPAVTPPRIDPPANEASNIPRPARGTPSLNDGIVVTSLASSVQTTLPAGQAVVSVIRARLDGGVELSDMTTTGLLMIIDDAGNLSLIAEGHLAMVHHVEDHWTREGMLGAGDSAVVGLGTKVRLRDLDDTPVNLTIIAVLPASSSQSGASLGVGSN